MGTEVAVNSASIEFLATTVTAMKAILLIWITAAA